MTHSTTLNPQLNNGLYEVSPLDLHQHSGNSQIIDVRTPGEFNGELGHIKGATLKVLGPDLVNYLNLVDKNEQIVFVCRSGGRSGQATRYAMDIGFKNVINMTGGMMMWNMHQLPIEK